MKCHPFFPFVSLHGRRQQALLRSQFVSSQQTLQAVPCSLRVCPTSVRASVSLSALHLAVHYTIALHPLKAPARSGEFELIMMATTGDVRGNIERLKAELRKVQYPGPVDDKMLANGEPGAFLPMLHYALLSFSRTVARALLDRGFDLAGKSDLRFIEGVIRVLQDVFNYRPGLLPGQILTRGFAERKVILVHDIVVMCKKWHNEDVQERKRRHPSASRARASSREGQSTSAAQAKVKIVGDGGHEAGWGFAIRWAGASSPTKQGKHFATAEKGNEAYEHAASRFELSDTAGSEGDTESQQFEGHEEYHEGEGQLAETDLTDATDSETENAGEAPNVGQRMMVDEEEDEERIGEGASSGTDNKPGESDDAVEQAKRPPASSVGQLETEVQRLKQALEEAQRELQNQSAKVVVLESRVKFLESQAYEEGKAEEGCPLCYGNKAAKQEEQMRQNAPREKYAIEAKDDDNNMTFEGVSQGLQEFISGVVSRNEATRKRLERAE